MAPLFSLDKIDAGSKIVRGAVITGFSGYLVARSAVGGWQATNDWLAPVAGPSSLPAGTQYVVDGNTGQYSLTMGVDSAGLPAGPTFVPGAVLGPDTSAINLADLTLEPTYAAGTVGTSLSARVLANIQASQAARAASNFDKFADFETAYNLNWNTAYSFYTGAGLSDLRALANMRGIDLTQPVTVERLWPGTVLRQDVLGAQGRYFTLPGTQPLEVGVGNGAARWPTLFANDTPVTALRSTASNFVWPAETYVPGAGGGVQYFVPDTEAFAPFSQ